MGGKESNQTNKHTKIRGALTTLYLSVLDDLRLFVMGLLATLVSLIICADKKALNSTKLTLFEHVTIYWSIHEQLSGQINMQAVKVICIYSIFIFDDPHWLLTKEVTSCSLLPYTYLTIKATWDQYSTVNKVIHIYLWLTLLFSWSIQSKRTWFWCTCKATQKSVAVQLPPNIL